jgi:Fur family ferric uptake transcriptional regulator
VLDEATSEHAHLLVAEIVDRARKRAGDLSVQTVYDCLETFANARLVRRVETAGSPARYETRVGDNHHHLICRACGTTVDVDCAVGATPCLEPSDDHGFVVDEAEVVFWGHCAACSEQAQGTSALN